MKLNFVNTGCVLAPSSGQIPVNRQRRTFIGGAVAAVLVSSMPVKADFEDLPNDPFILLLHGIYRAVPAGGGPIGNLGLTTVNLSDSSYSKTKIYPIFGVHGANDQKKAIGTFYVQFNGSLCAYDLPGGSIAMNFFNPPPGAPAGFNGFVPFPDGAGGTYLEGTSNWQSSKRKESITLFREVITTLWIDYINWLMAISMNSVSAISVSMSSRSIADQVAQPLII